MCLSISNWNSNAVLTYVVWFNWTVIGEHIIYIVQGNRTPLPLPPLMFWTTSTIYNVIGIIVSLVVGVYVIGKLEEYESPSRESEALRFIKQGMLITLGGCLMLIIIFVALFLLVTYYSLDLSGLLN